jgi:hypothetical protein
VKADVKKTRLSQDQDADCPAPADFSAGTPPPCASGIAKLKPEKSNGSRMILPRGSDEINKNETHNNEPTYEKKDIH